MASIRETYLTDALRVSGEVGNDLLAVDWERTPLGAPNTWPSSLQTIVRVVLTSRFSMWMAWGPELTFFCNDAYRRDTLGAKYPWALGRPASEVWAEIWPEIGPRIEHVLRTGEATWDESLLLFLERSGYEEETYHTFSYSPLSDDSGAIAGMLCVVNEDTDRVIGERRMATLRDLGSVSTAAEDERGFLHQSARELEKNPQSLPFVLIYTLDGSGVARLAATAGVGPDDDVAPEVIALEDERQPWPARALARGETAWELIDLSSRFRSVPTGAWPAPPTHAVAVPLPGAPGAPPVGFMVAGVNHYRPIDDVYRGWIGLIGQRLGTGVTAARSYAAERARAEQLAELDRAKSAFFSNVSHEFRTPLTLMLAPLQDALHAGAALDPDAVELVHSNGVRLLKLVGSLLDFSKLEAGRLQASFRPVDAAAFTTELVGTFSDACRRAGLSLEIHCDELPARVYMDPDLWERVVLNLVSNAFKVTVSGGIAVRLWAQQNMLALSVADTGPGIPQDEQERIFERFHRIRGVQARSHEGTGIGLALVQEIVQLHGGRVTVNSAPGLGAEFLVEIPFGREHLPAGHLIDQPGAAVPGIADLFVQEALAWLPESDSPHEPEPEPVHGRRSAARVLVADDNPDLRTYLTRLLEPHWTVEAVDDGLAALEAIRRDPPDLVVTDVMMPRLDGFGLLEAIRSDPETRELPVVMLSARAGEEASIEGLSAGADDYLPKPFSGRELLARVRSHLELSLARRQASEDVRAERALLEQTLRQLPVGVLVADLRARMPVLMNHALAEILGMDPDDSNALLHAVMTRIYLSDRKTPAAGRGIVTRALELGAVAAGERVYYHAPDGTWRTLSTGAAPVMSPAGEIVAAVCVLEDITERLRNEQLLAGQRDIMTMIARGEPLEAMLERVVRVAEELSQSGAIGSIRLVSPDREHLINGVAPNLPDEYVEEIDGIPIKEGAGACGTAARRHEPVVVSDIESDPLFDDYREFARSHGLRACWSTPIIASGGRLIGTFAIYHREPHVPSAASREVVELLARTAAVAIERARDVEQRTRQLRELQTTLLPPALPVIDGLQAAAAFHPGDRSLEVGGDFYDLFALGESSWGLVIGDVVGHGAEAASVTALARNITWHSARASVRADEVLASVSDALAERSFGRFCTAIFGRVELTGPGVRLTLASGGHPPPILRRADGTVELVSEHGPLLGVIENPRFPVRELELGAGDSLVLYTDGLIERNPRVQAEEGLARLIATLPDGPAEEMLDALEDAALGPRPRRPYDDVAILIVRVPGPIS